MKIMIKLEELESIQIGNMLRNIHTGDCHPLDKIDVVTTYNPATKQKDLQIFLFCSRVVCCYHIYLIERVAITRMYVPQHITNLNTF